MTARNASSGRIRGLYFRVLTVQAATLLALWLLQAAFGAGSGAG
jgi:hypothetical protein